MSSHTFWVNAKRKIASVEAEGLFLDCTPIFGLHYSDFIPTGPGSYLCVLCLMAFPYLSLPRTTWRPAHSVHMSVCNLNKSCVFFVVRFTLPFPQRSKGYFILDLPLGSSIFPSYQWQSVGRMNTLSIFPLWFLKHLSFPF